MKRDLKQIGVNIKSREIFVLVYYLKQKESTSATWIVTLFRMGLFGAAHGRGAKGICLQYVSVTRILQW